MIYLILKIVAAMFLIAVGVVSLIKPMVLRSAMAVHIMTVEQYKRNTKVVGGFLILLAIVGLVKMM